jgi:20S proteasome subunit alpha 6
MTDFKLVGIEIKQLGWSWGVIPSPQKADLAVEPNRESPGPIKAEADERVLSDKVSTQPSTGQDDPNVDMKAEPSEVYSLPTKPDLGLPPVPHTLDGPAVPSPPPAFASISTLLSRLRILCLSLTHPLFLLIFLLSLPPRVLLGKASEREQTMKRTTVLRTAHRITSAAHQDDAVSVTAHPDQDGFGGSAAPSVGESTSEGDWLMAAIGEDSNEGDGTDASRHPPHDSHMSNGKLDVFSSSRSRGRG